MALEWPNWVREFCPNSHNSPRRWRAPMDLKQVLELASTINNIWQATPFWPAVSIETTYVLLGHGRLIQTA